MSGFQAKPLSDAGPSQDDKISEENLEHVINLYGLVESKVKLFSKTSKGQYDLRNFCPKLPWKSFSQWVNQAKA